MTGIHLNQNITMRKSYSFIIPHHNSPKLLDRCINSIPLRDDIEIIVVDDNSEPNKQPFNLRRDVSLITIDKKDSKGAGKARNEGMKVASGEWLLFADCDDFYHDGFISELDKYKDSDNEVIYFCIDSVYSDTLEPAGRDAKLKSIFARYDGSLFSVDELKYKVHGPWFKMIKRDHIMRLGLQYEEVMKGNDIQFGYILGYFTHRFTVLNKPLYVLTHEKNSLSFGKRSIESYISTIEVHSRMYEFYKLIGRNEWVKNDWIEFARPLKQRGLLFFFSFIKDYLKRRHYIESEKYRYVNIIRQMENK